MSTSLIIVIVVLIVLALAALVATTWRHRRLRNRFGPEYDRVLSAAENRRAAEHELAQREARHAQFTLRDLPAESRQRYDMEWAHIQERFVDDPADAVAAADRMVTAMLGEIGYPTQDFDQLAADLSVRHARVVSGYRRAHGVLTNQATLDPELGQPTDDLRHALLDYRAVTDSILGRDRDRATSNA